MPSLLHEISLQRSRSAQMKRAIDRFQVKCKWSRCEDKRERRARTDRAQSTQDETGLVDPGDVVWADLPKQIVTIDRSFLSDRVGHLSRRQIELLLLGIDTVLGR